MSCNKQSNVTFKYQDNDDLFSCESVNMDLIKEAKYAFEDYIEKHYSFQNPKSVDQGYFYYWEISKSPTIPAVEFVNPHVLKIRDELKKIKNLWHFNGDIASLNYAHPLVKCLGANMVNQELKNTFNTLIDTKTFKDRVFLALLKRDPTAIRKDVGLSTYLALDTFYARILTLDFTNLEELQQINANRYFEKQRKEMGEELKNVTKDNLIPIDSLEKYR